MNKDEETSDKRAEASLSLTADPYQSLEHEFKKLNTILSNDPTLQYSYTTDDWSRIIHNFKIDIRDAKVSLTQSSDGNKLIKKAEQLLARLQELNVGRPTGLQEPEPEEEPLPPGWRTEAHSFLSGPAGHQRLLTRVNYRHLDGYVLPPGFFIRSQKEQFDKDGHGAGGVHIVRISDGKKLPVNWRPITASDGSTVFAHPTVEGPSFLHGGGGINLFRPHTQLEWPSADGWHGVPNIFGPPPSGGASSGFGQRLANIRTYKNRKVRFGTRGGMYIIYNGKKEYLNK